MNKLVLTSADGEAEFWPDYGGNCVRFDCGRARLLRTPASEREMAETPLLYGMPLLVPPNRIRGGAFRWQGREYRFPVNEPQYGAHCHGALYRTPADGYAYEEGGVRFFFESTRRRPYLGFPHPCRLTLFYRLEENGVVQRLCISNDDDVPMPFAAAFHTTFRLDFDGNPENCVLYAPVVRRFPRDQNFIPTGEVCAEFAEKAAMNAGGYRPACHPISEFTEVSGPMCRLLQKASGSCIEYRADPAYRFRHFFNGSSREWVCIEPQTCRIDGINVWGEDADNGVIAVPPGESVVLESSLRFLHDVESNHEQ